MKYQFIDAQSHSYGVHALCKALDVSRSGYYAARRRLQWGPDVKDQRPSPKPILTN